MWTNPQKMVKSSLFKFYGMLTKCVPSDTGIMYVHSCPPATVYTLSF